MKLLLLTILLAASPVMAQNPSWDAWREKRELARKMDAMAEQLSEHKAEIAALKSSLAHTDQLLWASITGTGISGALGAAALRRRKQD